MKITDPDERVREATALIFSKLEFEVARQTLTKETLVVLSDRFSDKKVRRVSFAAGELCLVRETDLRFLCAHCRSESGQRPFTVWPSCTV